MCAVGHLEPGCVVMVFQRLSSSAWGGGQSVFCYLTLHIICTFSLQIASPCGKEKELFSSWLLVTDASVQCVSGHVLCLTNFMCRGKSLVRKDSFCVTDCKGN